MESQRKRLSALVQTLSWARACKQLISQPGWSELVKKNEADISDIGRRFTDLQLKPERMEIIAERADSRRTFLQEVEQAAQQLEALEERYEVFNKIVNP